MLIAFKDYIDQTQLFQPTDQILLAVSGGIDSMVMAHLFKAANLNFGIAHCNFKLRGKDSDADALFVQALAADWNIPFHTIEFNTIEESKKQKKSTEMVARDLRYAWFDKLLQIHDYQYIATAHHLNDSLETVLLNLVKGTGIRGLHGIPIKNGTIIRPLSFAKQADILAYANKHSISFREDSTNQSTDIQRNLIRHQVIPSLKEINPSLETTFSRTLSQLRETEQLFLWAVDNFKTSLVHEAENLIKIEIAGLKKTLAKGTILFEIIYEFGFNRDHVNQILRSIDHVGAQFYSKTHHILIERKYIIIKGKQTLSPVWLTVAMLPDQLALPHGYFSAAVLKDNPTNLNLGKATALVDLAKIKLPLIIRNWKEGDRFQPLGMKGKSKKVKDYLRDQKLSIFDKELVLVLESDGQIVWVIGYRADERFKVEASTEQILMMERLF